MLVQSDTKLALVVPKWSVIPVLELRAFEPLRSLFGKQGVGPSEAGTVESKSRATPQVRKNHSHQKAQSALGQKQVIPFKTNKTKQYNAEYVNSFQKSTVGEKLLIFVSLKRFQQRVSLNMKLAQWS